MKGEDAASGSGQGAVLTEEGAHRGEVVSRAGRLPHSGGLGAVGGAGDVDGEAGEVEGGVEDGGAEDEGPVAEGEVNPFVTVRVGGRGKAAFSFNVGRQQ